MRRILLAATLTLLAPKGGNAAPMVIAPHLAMRSSGSLKPARLQTYINTLIRRMIRPGKRVQGSGTFDAAIRDVMAHK